MADVRQPVDLWNTQSNFERHHRSVQRAETPIGPLSRRLRHIMPIKLRSLISTTKALDRTRSMFELSTSDITPSRSPQAGTHTYEVACRSLARAIDIRFGRAARNRNDYRKICKLSNSMGPRLLIEQGRYQQGTGLEHCDIDRGSDIRGVV